MADSQPVKPEWLADIDAEFPPSVTFQKPGDMVVGQFLNAELADNGAGYGPSIVVTFIAKEGTNVKTLEAGKDGKPVVGKACVPGTEYSMWLFGTTLDTQFAEQAPNVGEEFGVLYWKEQTSKNNQKYKNFRVKVNRPKSVTWEKLREAKRTGTTDNG